MAAQRETGRWASCGLLGQGLEDYPALVRAETIGNLVFATSAPPSVSTSPPAGDETHARGMLIDARSRRSGAVVAAYAPGSWATTSAATNQGFEREGTPEMGDWP
jgi:hypothetical protein